MGRAEILSSINAKRSQLASTNAEIAELEQRWSDLTILLNTIIQKSNETDALVMRRRIEVSRLDEITQRCRAAKGHMGKMHEHLYGDAYTRLVGKLERSQEDTRARLRQVEARLDELRSYSMSLRSQISGLEYSYQRCQD
jgi:predicted  nucleic acid-binding Zn-ribbon protein